MYYEIEKWKIDFCYRNFQSFEVSQSVDPNPDNYANAGYTNTYYDPTAYAAPDPIYDGATSDFDNEPPLLEGKTWGKFTVKFIQ